MNSGPSEPGRIAGARPERPAYGVPEPRPGPTGTVESSTIRGVPRYAFVLLPVAVLGTALVHGFRRAPELEGTAEEWGSFAERLKEELGDSIDAAFLPVYADIAPLAMPPSSAESPTTARLEGLREFSVRIGSARGNIAGQIEGLAMRRIQSWVSGAEDGKERWLVDDLHMRYGRTFAELSGVFGGNAIAELAGAQSEALADAAIAMVENELPPAVQIAWRLSGGIERFFRRVREVVGLDGGSDASPAGYLRELREVVDGEREMLKAAMAAAVDCMRLETLGPFVPSSLTDAPESRACAPVDQ